MCYPRYIVSEMSASPPVSAPAVAPTTTPAKLRNGLIMIGDQETGRKGELLHLAAIIAGGLAAQHSINKTDSTARIAARALDIAEALIEQVQKR